MKKKKMKYISFINIFLLNNVVSGIRDFVIKKTNVT